MKSMKNKKLICWLLLLALGGCLPSLHQLYTDDVLVFEEELLGKYLSNDEGIWQFTRADENTYELSFFDGKKGKFDVHLVALDAMMFLDLYPKKEMIDDLQDFYKCHLVPAHTFMKVEQIEPTLKLRVLNQDKVSNMLAQDPNLLSHEVVEGGVVLTASPRQLQAFMIEHANEPGVFNDPIELVRLKPFYDANDVIFDERLIGAWESEDDEILDIGMMGKKAYDIMLVQENGSELEQVEFAAELVKLRQEKFLAVYYDKTTVLKPSSFEVRFTPDKVAKLKQVTDTELTLEFLVEEEKYRDLLDSVDPTETQSWWSTCKYTRLQE